MDAEIKGLREANDELLGKLKKICQKCYCGELELWEAIGESHGLILKYDPTFDPKALPDPECLDTKKGSQNLV